MKEGSVVELEYNEKQKTISIWVDDHCYGLAFDSIETPNEEPIFPAIDIHDLGAAVQFVL